MQRAKNFCGVLVERVVVDGWSMVMAERQRRLSHGMFGRTELLPSSMVFRWLTIAARLSELKGRNCSIRPRLLVLLPSASPCFPEVGELLKGTSQKHHRTHFNHWNPLNEAGDCL